MEQYNPNQPKINPRNPNTPTRRAEQLSRCPPQQPYPPQQGKPKKPVYKNGGSGY